MLTRGLYFQIKHLKPRLKRRIQQRVAIRCLHRVHPGQIRILRCHQLLDRIPFAAFSAVQAQHPVQAGVKLDDVMVAGPGQDHKRPLGH